MTSLSHTAREIRISPAGLLKFLAGAEPYSNTRRKLETWYALRPDSSGGEISVDAAYAALALFVEGFAPAERRQAQERIVGAVEAAYSQAGLARPSWLDGLREQILEREREDSR